MRKRNLALWPIQWFEPIRRAAVKLQPPADWNQEEESHRNRSREIEPVQEKIQRLVPGFDLKKCVL